MKIIMLALISGVVFVNGFTDAPNAIVGVVATKTMEYRRASRLAACFNMLGLFAVSVVNASVAETVLSFMDFGGASAAESLAALVSAMAAIIVFAVSAWAFGIPSSESHSLIAAVAGASLALGSCGIDRNADAWCKLALGLVMSVGLSFTLGVLLSKAFGKSLKRVSTRAVEQAQVCAACAVAFMHGAQDGQKFAAVFIAVDLLFQNKRPGVMSFAEHIPAVVLCGVLMALGTKAGGKRIIDNIGGKMVKLKKRRSIAADAASGLCLFAASLAGIPMSTTHTKTAAIMGACFFDKENPVNYKIIGGILLAWIITFPASFALGYIFTKLIIFFV